MAARTAFLVALTCMGSMGVSEPRAWAAQLDLELFAPAQEATRAIEAARRAKAPELAPEDLRLAHLYTDDAKAALNPPDGPPDVEKATRLFRLAGAQAKLAQARAIEIVHEREAAAAGKQYLDALQYDRNRMLPPGPTLAEAMADYRRSQREAAAARAARRAAAQQVDRLLNELR